jgi:hypothetical protein
MFRARKKPDAHIGYQFNVQLCQRNANSIFAVPRKSISAKIFSRKLTKITKFSEKSKMQNNLLPPSEKPGRP